MQNAWSILQYFRPSLGYHLSLKSLFCLFLSGCFTPVLHRFYTGFTVLTWVRVRGFVSTSPTVVIFLLHNHILIWDSSIPRSLQAFPIFWSLLWNGNQYSKKCFWFLQRFAQDYKNCCSPHVGFFVNCQHIGQGKLLLYQQGTLIHSELFYQGGYFITLLWRHSNVFSLVVLCMATIVMNKHAVLHIE